MNAGIIEDTRNVVSIAEDGRATFPQNKHETAVM